METLVLYPITGIGHLIAMVELGKLVLSQSKTLSSITILIPYMPLDMNKAISSYISSVSSFPSISFEFLPPSSFHGNPSQYSNFEAFAFEVNRSNNPNLLIALKSLTTKSHVCAFVLDFFCYAALEVSRSLNIPTYFFYPSGACALALSLNFPTFDRIAMDSFRNLQRSFEIPGLFSVPASQMLEPMLDRGPSYYEFMRMGETLAKADGIIVNTFEELEVRAVLGLKEGTILPGTTIPPVYCIGPLIANRGDDGGPRHECLSWLDNQPARSVVFLSFGSMGLFSMAQIRKIALGLERSAVRFLWVVRAPLCDGASTNFGVPKDPDLGSLLPEGFLERTKDRGLVIKSWAPQIAVLGHDSVGAFVTHCGWNSTLEAVCAGVPLVAWPLYAEQRFNRIVLVQEIGIALPVNESEDRFVSSDEIEKRVKHIMGSEGAVVRKRVLDLKGKAGAALSDEGLAKLALFKLVESWKQ